MTERDYDAWVAMRVFGEAVTRAQTDRSGELRDYMLSDRFEVGAFKGQGLTFRRWDQQLREPILLVTPRMLVSVSPQDQFLHQRTPVDTPGLRPAREQMPPERRREANDQAHECGDGDHCGRGSPWRSWRARRRRASSSSPTRRATRSRCRRRHARGHGHHARSATARAASSSARRQVCLYLRLGRRHDPDLRHASRKVVGTLPSGPDPEQLAISADGKLLYVANEDDNMVTVIDIDSRQAICRDPGRRRAGGHGRQPRRQVGGRTPPRPPTWRTSSTPRPTRSPTTSWSTSARATPSGPPTTPEIWVSLRGRRHGQRDRQRDAQGHPPYHLRDPRRAAARRSSPVGDQDHQGPQHRLRGAGRRPTGSR